MEGLGTLGRLGLEGLLLFIYPNYIFDVGQNILINFVHNYILMCEFVFCKIMELNKWICEKKKANGLYESSISVKYTMNV